MKRILAVLLAVLMLCLALTACNNTPAGNDDPTPTQGADAPTDAPEEDETEGGKYMPMDGGYPFEQYKLPAYDLTNKEILIMTNAEYVTDPTKFDAGRDVYGLTYKTKLVTSGEWVTQFISMFMANQSPDIILNGAMILNMINKNYYYPIDELVDFDLPIWQELKSSIENMYYKDHIYSVAANTYRGEVLFYNKTLFSEMGVKTPDEYYAEGNWNWDTFRQLAQEMTIDSDGDGIPEVYGAYVEQGLCLLGSGIDYVTMNRDGTITNNIPSEAMARAVNYYVQLYNDNILYEGADNHTAFAAGKIAMGTIAVWQARTAFAEMFKADAVGYVPYPKDPATDKYYVGEEFWGDNVPSNAPNLNGAAAFICAERYNKLMSDLDEEVIAEKEAMSLSEYVDTYGATYDFDKFLAEELYDEKFTPVNKISYNLQIAQKWAGDFWFRPLAGEPWATIAEEISPAIDEHIKNLINS
ncbi:MAG: extracellular solute-binding protein [Ruminococcaceae bacterium]|nr:extracellular solute-binding protein [Oscillospiraceae bacterium]